MCPQDVSLALGGWRLGQPPASPELCGSAQRSGVPAEVSRPPTQPPFYRRAVRGRPSEEKSLLVSSLEEGDGGGEAWEAGPPPGPALGKAVKDI